MTPVRARRRHWWIVWATGAASLAVLASLGGCSTLGYYAQSIGGHLDLMAKRRPVQEVIEDPDTPPSLKEKLEQVDTMLVFAARELALPSHGAYRSYVALDRPFVVWNVVATPEFSLEPETWCFPVAGCVAYRGYFEKADAQAYADTLRGEGFDVSVAGARAYSTLGWFADPILNTMLSEREYRLAGVLFHELAHQRLYVAGDSTFNESFAVAVERYGVRAWLASNGDARMRADYRVDLSRRADFLALVRRTRDELESVYASSGSETDKRARKQAIFAALRARYAELKRSWGGYTGYDDWFDQDPNNAKLALIGTYTNYVPAFERLLARHENDLAAFYRQCESLAALSREARDARLEALAGG